MRDLFYSNPYLFWSFTFFFFFAAFSFLISPFRRFFGSRIDGGKIPGNQKLLFKALKESHFGNEKEYLRSLRELAGKYPEETEFFIMAGDIARKTNPLKALEIHRDLLFRSGTSGKLRGKVLKHVGEDYLLAGKNAKAVNALKESSKIDDNSDVRLLLAKAYESLGDIEEASENLKKSIKMSKTDDFKPLKDLFARAVLNSGRKGNKDEPDRWINELKLYASKEETLLLSIKQAVFSGKEKKAASLLKDIAGQGQNDPRLEIAARGFLLMQPWGKDVNTSVEGKYRRRFEENMKGITFVCSECHNSLSQEEPVCDKCFSFSGKKICMFLEE